ncbi:MAG: hypothetical protein ACRYFZ_21070 [Janthinobacterium lividum]
MAITVAAVGITVTEAMARAITTKHLIANMAAATTTAPGLARR